jgi:hypothetical protein
MNDSIDFISIVKMLKFVPKKYKTKNIRIARGQYKLPTSLKQLIKKIINDPS